MRRVCAFLVFGLLVGALTLLAAAPASAHTHTVSGEVGCAEDGSFLITWTITNDFDLVATVDVSSPAGGLSQSSVAIPPATDANTSSTVTQVLPATAAGETISLNTSATWLDGVTEVSSGDVTLEDPCPPPPAAIDVGGITVTRDVTQDVAQPVSAAPRFTG
jgi:hypothetical protein